MLGVVGSRYFGTGRRRAIGEGPRVVARKAAGLCELEPGEAAYSAIALDGEDAPERRWLLHASKLLVGSKIVPVVVLASADVAVPLAEVLLEAGLGVIEVTLRTDDALQGIEKWSQ